MASTTTMPACAKRCCSSLRSAAETSSVPERSVTSCTPVALGLLEVVVGIAEGEVAQRRLGLRQHVGLVVLDVEARLGRVVDAPDDRRGDLDRVAALVVDLQLLAVEVVRAHRDLASSCRTGWPSAGRARGRCRGSCRRAAAAPPGSAAACTGRPGTRRRPARRRRAATSVGPIGRAAIRPAASSSVISPTAM